MRTPALLSFTCAISLVAGVALIVACKTESASENNVRISPARVVLAKGQSQTFTASGGYDYTWSLDGNAIADEWGYLSTRYGNQTVYTSTKEATTAGTFRAIHVTSTISGSGSSTSTDTNLPTPTTTSYAMTADAFVEHAVRYDALNVSPASLSGFRYGQSQTFTATGGNGPYRWNLENDSLGELTSQTGLSTTYSSTTRAEDDNTVNRLRCLSSDGQAVNVMIFHANENVTNETTSLSLSPPTATVTINGTAAFTASGGDGAYVWSLSTRDYGTLTFPSANSATYLCTDLPVTNAAVVVLSVSSAGETRQATIVHEPRTSANLAVSPASVTLTNLQSVTFTANGGELPYVWTAEPVGYGSLTQPSATQATYMRNYATAGEQTIIITVTSADGQSVQAQVSHRN